MQAASERSAVSAAALVLVAAMGIGRFAFTGLYPQMVQEGVLTVAGGSYAASANYAGYLVGAILAGFFPTISSRRKCEAALIATAVSIAALGLPLPQTAIIFIRGSSGIASAIAMVAASHWLIHDRQDTAGAAGLYSGVGIGIALSAEMIAAGRLADFSSSAIWFALGAACVIVAGWSAWLMGRAVSVSATASRHAADAVHAAMSAQRLTLVYGLAGFGYIITATYLPLLVRSALGTIDPVHIWALFGLGAIPSCFLWHRWHMRWGTQKAMMINLIVQAIGVALPAVAQNPAAYIASALLVGGTFLGTVTIAMPAARHVAHTVRFNIMAVLTSSYAFGQIVGPLLAAAIFTHTHSFTPSLWLACLALLIGASACYVPMPGMSGAKDVR
jgi:MFS family permease